MIKTLQNLFIKVVICKEELFINFLHMCTLLYTTVAGATVLKSGFLNLRHLIKDTWSGNMVWDY